MKSTLTDWISSLKKHLIRKWIEPPKPLGPCLTTVWGILQAISEKPEIWQKSFRNASPGFYEQVAKPTLAWGYPAWTTWLCLTKSEFSMMPSGALDRICFHESCYCKQERHFLFWGYAKKMSDNGSDTGHFTQASWVRIKTFIIHSKQKRWDQKYRLDSKLVG